MAPRTTATDNHRRPYIQIRLYGQWAIDVDARAAIEGKARATLITELIAAAWNIDTTDDAPIAPAGTFTRVPPKSMTRHDVENATHAQAPPQEGTRQRAQVFAPRGHR
jgi:hypothetical protein